MKSLTFRAAALFALLVALSGTASAQSPSQFFNPVGGGGGYGYRYRPYYHQGFTPRPTQSRVPGYVGPEQHFDANVAYSSSYYRGPGGEIVRGENLPQNSRSLGYRSIGSYGASHPRRGR